MHVFAQDCLMRDEGLLGVVLSGWEAKDHFLEDIGASGAVASLAFGLLGVNFAFVIKTRHLSSMRRVAKQTQRGSSVRMRVDLVAALHIEYTSAARPYVCGLFSPRSNGVFGRLFVPEALGSGGRGSRFPSSAEVGKETATHVSEYTIKQ